MRSFVFDVDGVMKRGGNNYFDFAKQALRSLYAPCGRRLRTPFIFLTNGGGVREADRARHYSEVFGLPILPEQVVLAHTPMRDAFIAFRERDVLCLGRADDDLRGIAADYGFRRAWTLDDVLAHTPQLNPFGGGSGGVPRVSGDPSRIELILVLHDPETWELHLQVLLDLLCHHLHDGHDPSPSFRAHDAPLLAFSNPDLLWSAEFPHPRLAQGAFREALSALYRRCVGRELEFRQFGKPTAETYECALSALRSVARIAGLPEVEERGIVAVGDNVHSDVRGANAAGWTSALVRTGVWRDGDAHDARFVFDHVGECVKHFIPSCGD